MRGGCSLRGRPFPRRSPEDVTIFRASDARGHVKDALRSPGCHPSRADCSECPREIFRSKAPREEFEYEGMFDRFTLQHPPRVGEDVVVIEGQDGWGEQWPQRGISCVVASLESACDRAVACTRSESHSDTVPARISPWLSVGTDLHDGAYAESGLLLELPPCRIHEFLVFIDESSRERPPILERLMTAADQGYLKAAVPEDEHHEIDGDRRPWVAIAVGASPAQREAPIAAAGGVVESWRGWKGAGFALVFILVVHDTARWSLALPLPGPPVPSRDGLLSLKSRLGSRVRLFRTTQEAGPLVAVPDAGSSIPPGQRPSPDWFASQALPRCGVAPIHGVETHESHPTDGSRCPLGRAHHGGPGRCESHLRQAEG